MDRLGEYLKKERERKGITIEDAAKITRIRKTYLQEIEDGNFEIQSPVFIKGFLRSYAQYLGLDVADVLERYSREMFAEKQVEIKTETNEPIVRRKDRKYLIPGLIIASLIVIVTVFSLITRKEDFRPTVVAKTGVQTEPQVFKSETALGILTTHEVKKTAAEKPFDRITTHAKPAPTPTTPTVPAPAAPAVKPAVPAPTVPAPAQPVPAPIAPSPAQPVKPVMKTQTTEQPQKKYTLVITAREISWLRLAIDDRNPFETVLRKGETATWTANSKFTIVSGNGGGTELTLNGKSLGVMGETGKVTTRVLP